MYEKYRTDAIVLRGEIMGEADKFYTLFTREFGLVRARASAVRTEKSKMRYALQTFSYISLSLVKGRTGWRAAGAQAIDTPVLTHKRALDSYARIARLVERLVHGEEKSEYLFDALLGARQALPHTTEYESVELLAVIRVLYALGYIATKTETAELLAGAGYTAPELEAIERMRVQVLGMVNSALASTQL